MRTRIAFNNSWSETLGQLVKQDGSDKPGTSYAKSTTYPGWTISGMADYIVNQKLFIGFRAGRFLNDTHDSNVPDLPQFNFVSSTNIGMAGVPLSEQHASGFASIPSNSAVSFDTLTRNFAQIDATYYAHAGAIIKSRAESSSTTGARTSTAAISRTSSTFAGDNRSWANRVPSAITSSGATRRLRDRASSLRATSTPT
jgi:hypothetical protein